MMQDRAKGGNADKKKGGINLKQYIMMIALVAIFIIFYFLTRNGETGISPMASPMNVNNLLMQNSYVIILAVGMLLCIITGNVDLSVGSVVAFTGATCAILVLDYGVPVPLAFLIVLLVGFAIGMWQGFFIAKLHVPPFIVTLANMLIFRGLTMTILNGQTKGPLPEAYTMVGAGYLPTAFVQFGDSRVDMVSIIAGILASVCVVVMEMRNLTNKKKHNFETPPMWQTVVRLLIYIFLINFVTTHLALYSGLPMVLLIMLILVLAYGFVTSRTVVGRQVYAVGGNKKAAALSGIKTDKVMFWVYTNMSVLAALAGIVLSARNASATPKAGDGFEMDAIASCYLGGASTYGGTGSVLGAIVGALIMGILNNGMSLMGVSVDMQRVFKGLVLLGAVTFDMLSQKKSKI